MVHGQASVFDFLNPLDRNNNTIDNWTVYSVGGGDIVEEGQPRTAGESIYPLTKIKDIQAECEKNGTSYWEYVDKYEGSGIWEYLGKVWNVMKAAVERGIEAAFALRKPGDESAADCGNGPRTGAGRNRGHGS